LYDIFDLISFSGAYIYILFELPVEESQRQLKLNKTQDVNDAAVYLRTIFWDYANNPKYNLTPDDFEAKV
jgi:hypothetical protein